MWSLLWQLQISFNKCYIINIGKHLSAGNDDYKLGDVTLKSVSNVSDLGVTVDKLKFSGHIVKIDRKAHTRANLIVRCCESRHTEYSDFSEIKVNVRRILEFNSSI